MKLRNKKTGEIDNWCIDKDVIRTCSGSIIYNSLAELNEEWEDVPEEPKEYWYIDPMVCDVYFTKIKNDEDLCEFNKQIGNYFDTREEAEKAVEKLKAWKRLKDKGFKFERWQFLDDRSGIWVQGNLVPDIVDELDILFGGEE